ncbi:tyrosine-type recombinase/integrase [Nitrospinota bacterium]
MQRKITKRIVDATNPARKDQVIWDTELRGFGLRCRANGGKFYVLKYRAGGRQRWATIGRHGSPWTPDTARTEARRLLGEVAGGKDPSTTRDQVRGTPTMVHLAERFLAEHVEAKTKPRTIDEYRRLMEKFILPDLGRFRVPDVTRADVMRLHNRHRKTPYQANRILAVLSKMFNLGEMWGYTRGGSNPCRHVEKFKEQKRERYLSELELRRLGKALRKAEKDESATPGCIAAIRLLIHTGCRLNEILSLRWDDVNLERAEIRLQDSKTGSKTIHLNPQAVEIINIIPPILGNPYVIIGERRGKHLVNLQKPWRRIRKMARLEDLRLHDLRHTFASIGAASGLGLPIIGALLGHADASTTDKYAHLAADPLKAAIALIGEKLFDALGGN